MSCGLGVALTLSTGAPVTFQDSRDDAGAPTSGPLVDAVVNSSGGAIA